MGNAYRRPMFAQLRSKEWVLVAHAAVVTGNLALANFFKTSLGNGTRSYAAPVMLATAGSTAVDVRLRCDAGPVAGCGDIPRAQLIASVLHPGTAPETLVPFEWGTDGELIFRNLPLGRSCAMIVLRDSADPPPPPGPSPLPPAPPPAPGPSPPSGSCTSGCQLAMLACNSSDSEQLFTFDGKHLHHAASQSCLDMNKATLAVGLWSPCEKLTEDDQWWKFSAKSSAGLLSGLVEMKGVQGAHGSSLCLDVSLTTKECDATQPSEQWALQSNVAGAVLRHAAAAAGRGMCIGRSLLH